MDVREYLSIRRGYNLVRREDSGDSRLTFSEFAILCRLQNAGGSLKTSEIADYQGSLRPTMTHRTKHLSELDHIERLKGSSDRRNVVCKITDKGCNNIEQLCSRTCSNIPAGHALSRVTPDRMVRYVDAMGSVSCMSGDLILLGLYEHEGDTCSMSDLVEALGLLQPTVSMTVSSLVAQGYLERAASKDSSRTVRISLTPEGERAGREFKEQVEQLVVRRKPRNA